MLALARSSASWAGEPLSLRETISQSAFHDATSSPVVISGTCRDGNVLVRVTTCAGRSFTARAAATSGKFACRYPDDFPGADRPAPGMLFIDATSGADFDAGGPGHLQAEIAVIVRGDKDRAPELPSAFTTDLIHGRGRRDRACAQWPATRALVNLYMRSRAARLVGVGRSNFDLERDEDLEWFKQNLTLYEFDRRDRDWSIPLGRRVARTFWQSVWNTWFNSTNDHPLDGNPRNASPSNYLPYAFANDFADVLILELLRRRSSGADAGRQMDLCRDAARNLLAMQYREAGNFALPDASGRRETYTAGAFRYGMFENGELLTEGKGWFHDPKRRDHAGGGVMNGRAVWALGELLRSEADGPLAPAASDALALALKFCLHDGFTGGYTKLTRQGRPYWRDAGEHAYLLLGMLAACEAMPDMKVPSDRTGSTALKDICVVSLDALADLEKPEHEWSVYPNVDSMAVAALAEGARLLSETPAAARWREVAARVADAWLAARVDPRECAGPPVHFGLRPARDRMTYLWPGVDHARIFHYQTGHWIHALADLYALTGEARYLQRAQAMVSYLCGDNPWHVRLLSELGGVYNWTDDTDGDGVQDLLKQDMYPESTAFCLIGILRLWQALRR